MNRHDIEYLYKDPERKNSVALVVIEGASEVFITKAYTDYYEVVSGSGVFVSMDGDVEVANVSRINLEPGSQFCVVPNELYRFMGDLVMLRTGNSFRQEGVISDPPPDML